MISPAGFSNRLVYLIQTKLQLELPADIVHDINSTMMNYADACTKVTQSERLYWQKLALEKEGRTNR